jgi:hypothetical protein
VAVGGRPAAQDPNQHPVADPLAQGLQRHGAPLGDRLVEQVGGRARVGGGWVQNPVSLAGVADSAARRWWAVWWPWCSLHSHADQVAIFSWSQLSASGAG